jgi:sialidase-1
MIHCTNTGLVYTNPTPHLKAIHAWHPSIAHLGGDELICAFDLGQAPESLDYRTYYSRSPDGGRTWEAPKRLFDDSVTKPATHTVRISRLRDGTLVGFGARFYRDNSEEGLTNRATLGFVPMDLIFFRSVDGGRNWHGPTVIAPPLEGPAFEICHSIVELNDGRWLAPTQTWPAWDGRSSHGWKPIALVSADQGRTWSRFLSLFDNRSESVIHFEQSMVQLADGRLLAVAWAYDRRTHETLPTPYTISNNGETFSASRPTGLCGQTAKLLALRDGRILCVYRRDDKPGLWAQLVRLDGDRWINVEEHALWSGDPNGSATTNMSDQLSSLKFGFPSMVESVEGNAKVVFWCSENGLHNIRWFDLSIAPAVSPPHFAGRSSEEGASARPVYHDGR